MSTTAGLVRIGNHVINMAAVNHIWFDDLEESAFIDFGWRPTSEVWDLVLIGTDARALKAHFDQEDDIQWE